MIRGAQLSNTTENLFHHLNRAASRDEPKGPLDAAGEVERLEAESHVYWIDVDKMSEVGVCGLDVSEVCYFIGSTPGSREEAD